GGEAWVVVSAHRAWGRRTAMSTHDQVTARVAPHHAQHELARRRREAEAEPGEVVEAPAVGGDDAVARTQPVAGGTAARGDLLDHHPGQAGLARAGRQLRKRGPGQARVEAGARQRARLLAQGRAELQRL